jgi:hypothetical protein
MLLFIVGFSTLRFIRLDIDRNETVIDEQLKDSVNNCRSKLIDEVKNVKEPKDVMIFRSIEKLHEHYRTYAK